MADTERPNRQSNMEKAEGDRASAEQYNEQGDTGITNRPIDEEIGNQERVPDRGKSKPGAHAG
jgi:hypothetical protein